MVLWNESRRRTHGTGHCCAISAADLATTARFKASECCPGQSICGGKTVVLEARSRGSAQAVNPYPYLKMKTYANNKFRFLFCIILIEFTAPKKNPSRLLVPVWKDRKTHQGDLIRDVSANPACVSSIRIPHKLKHLLDCCCRLRSSATISLMVM